jgi:tetratricopeptide (TPR) repeat protein
MSRAYHKKGMYKQALAELKKSYMGRGYLDVAEAMERGEAESGYAGAMIMAAKAREAHGDPTASLSIAQLYLHGGDNDKALEWIEKAHQLGMQDMVYLRVSPTYDPLRDDARYQDLVRRMNYPE